MNLQTLLQFSSANPGLGFLLIVCLFILSGGVLNGVYRLLTWPFKLANRWIRHQNIKHVGDWPPPWMDADGDWHESQCECPDGEECDPKQPEDPSEAWKCPDGA
jgi:hypothetical protein